MLLLLLLLLLLLRFRSIVLFPKRNATLAAFVSIASDRFSNARQLSAQYENLRQSRADVGQEGGGGTIYRAVASIVAAKVITITHL